MKEPIEIFDCASPLLQALPGGILLNTKAGGRLNTMTIGWGALGIEWGVPVFIAYVRGSRFTHSLLDENPEFTVCIPEGAPNRKITGFCGSVSGRDTDKVQEMGLTPEPPERISVPGFLEFPLTLECRVIYRREQDGSAIPPEHLARYYPPVGENGQADLHTVYYGQILSAYRIAP